MSSFCLHHELCQSGGEGLGHPLWAFAEQPSGAGHTAGVRRRATLQSAAHPELWRQCQRESLQGERATEQTRRSSSSQHSSTLDRLAFWNDKSSLLPIFLQVLYKILKSERVSERNKQRVKLKDFGYLGLVYCLEAIPVTMTTVRCLYEQVLATGIKRFWP